jgi:hypothetical protein
MAPEARLRRLEDELRREGCIVQHGSEYDRWDMHIRGGMLGSAQVRMAVEEHGSGRQFVRFRSWPQWSRGGLALTLLFAALALGAAIDGAWVACGILSAIVLGLTVSAIRDCATATGSVVSVLHHQVQEVEDPALDAVTVSTPWTLAEPAADHGRSLASENGAQPDRVGAQATQRERIAASSRFSTRLNLMRRED